MRSQIIFLFTGFLFAAGARAGEVDQINTMLKYFGPGCSSYGQLSQQADKSVEVLISVLEDIKNDPNCSSVASSVTSVQSLRTQVQNLAQMNNDDDKTVMGLQHKMSDLLSTLGTATNPAEISQIQDSLRTVRLELAQAQGNAEASAQNEAQQRRVDAIYNLSLTTDAFLGQLASNNLCWQGRPGILQALAGFGTSIGSSLALDVASGGTSVLFGAGARLVSQIANYFHQAAINKKISKFANEIDRDALACSMENLTEQYCTARERRNTIDFLDKTTAPAQATWDGVDLLNHDLPLLTVWLDHVQAGLTSTSGPVSAQHEELNKKEEKLKSTQERFNGAFGDAMKQYALAKTDDEKWSIQQKLITKIVGSIFDDHGSTVTNPFADNLGDFTYSQSSYLLLGLTAAQIDASYHENGPTSKLIDFQNQTLVGIRKGVASFKPDLFATSIAFGVWTDLANTAFKNYRQSIEQDDILKIFDEVSRPSTADSSKGNSPEKALAAITKFLLDARPKHFAEPIRKLIYEDTMVRLNELRKAIDGVPHSTDYQVQLDQIKDSKTGANLTDGTFFFQNRLEAIIRDVIIDDFFAGQSLNDDGSLQFYTSNEIIESLQSLTRQERPQLYDDAENAMFNLRGTIGNFYEVFQDPINQKLDEFKAANNQFHNGGAGGVTGDVKAKFCMGLLGAKQYDKNMKICEGATPKQHYASLPPPPTFSASLFKKSYEDRICIWRDYYRRQKIHSIYHIK